jgi:hypothetical protein
MTVQGIKEIKRAFAARKRRHAKGLRKGLYRAGLFLQRESQKIVPIELGVLRNSANTRMEGTGHNSAAVVSYGTNYAVYVHEDLEARHKPGKQAKFLEQPLREKRDRIGAIVIEAVERERR